MDRSLGHESGMTTYQQLQRKLKRRPLTWLVTGAAGFIGCNLVERLLALDQKVVGLDNFSTGKESNLEHVRQLVTKTQWKQFRMIRGDLNDAQACGEACAKVDYLLHQAALGSVPRSIADPLNSHASNVTGFLHILMAARDAKVKRFVYASSSAVYGDHPGLPKVENRTGHLLSPYAATKAANELYAEVFSRCYGMETIGLRYFNVFGPCQDPDGPYAAVIPRWISAMIHDKPVEINGDGKTSRDFCYVDNVVQANLLAATARAPGAANQVYNVALHEQTTLIDLFEFLRDRLAPHYPHLEDVRPIHRAFRPGDIRHSLADIRKARRLLGYAPTHRIADGLDAALDWYRANLG
jgi:UDP-N-acetylglucosamine/UDP-N-acetylgalactosamine 4-epimerase